MYPFLCLAPRKAREENFNAERAPRDPPFTAYIANLSYDVDTETVMEFFGHLNIKGMHNSPIYDECQTQSA